MLTSNINCHANKTKRTKRQIFLWNKADITLIKNHVTTEVSKFLISNTPDTSINHIWSSIKQIVDSSMKFVPTKFTSSRYSQPWVTVACKRLCRKKKRSYNRAKRTQLESDWDIYKILTKETRKECIHAYNKYIRDCICPDIRNNPKKFFSFIKSRKSDNIGVSPLRDGKCKIHICDKKKATLLNEQFVSVFSEEDDIIPHINSPRSIRMPEITVSVNGVRKLLSKLNPYKSSGPDTVSARFLKEVANEIAPALTLLFNASLCQGLIPNEWKEALINPIYKSGKKDRGNAENYRPISLTSVTCKVLEHIIHSNVMSHLENNGILSDVQHGFRKRRSCETQLVVVINDFAKALNNADQLDTVLLDFSKAFDKVNHRKLYLKLDHYGIRGKLLDWFKDFLTGRTQQVVINGESSSKANVTSGVPQGTVLGPLLFLIYINDLPEKVDSLRLFAHDSYLYRTINSTQRSLQLQEDLNALIEWEKQWSMEFHPDKCKILRITNKLKPIMKDYYMHNHKLETVDAAKYLGVLLHKKNYRGNLMLMQFARKQTKLERSCKGILKTANVKLNHNAIKLTFALNLNMHPLHGILWVKEIFICGNKLKWFNAVQLDLFIVTGVGTAAPLQ